MLIYLKYGRYNIPYYIQPTWDISLLKYHVAKQFGLSTDTIKLIFSGKILQDNELISSTTIHKECSILVMGAKGDLIDSVSTKDKYKMLYVTVTHNNKSITVNFDKHDLINQNKSNKIKYLHSQTSNNKSIALVKIYHHPDNYSRLRIRIKYNAKLQYKQKGYVANKMVDIKVTKPSDTINYDIFNSKITVNINEIPTDFEVQRDTLDYIMTNYKNLDADKDLNWLDKYYKELSGLKLYNPLLDEIVGSATASEYMIEKMRSIIKHSLKVDLLDIKYIVLNSTVDITQLNGKTFLFTENNYAVKMEGLDLIKFTVDLYRKKMLDGVSFVKNMYDIENVIHSCKLCNEDYLELVNFVNVNINGNIMNGLHCHCCIKKTIFENINSLCNDIDGIDFIDYLDDSEINSISDTLFRNHIRKQLAEKRYISCPKCDLVFEIIETDISGEKKRYNELRMKCTSCKYEFCNCCFISPYHTDYTCEEYNIYMNSPKCKYCKTVLDSEDDDIVCKNEICQNYEKGLVSRYTSCTDEKGESLSHINYGFLQYEVCLDCENVKHNICNLCMLDELYKKPCIKLDCGHIVHLDCLEKNITAQNSRSEITLNHIYCTICFYKLSHPHFDEVLNKVQEISREIETQTIMIMKDELMKKDLTKNILITEQYKKYRFFKCNSCIKIYFGGVVNCNGDNQNNQDNQDNQDNQNNDEEEKICPACATVGEKECKKHGKGDNILYKCCCCCNPAVWFCFGTTHFCEDCHNNYGNKQKNPTLCPGKKTCPLGIEHIPNDGKTQFSIGCVLCLPDKIKQKFQFKYRKSRY